MLRGMRWFISFIMMAILLSCGSYAQWGFVNPGATPYWLHKHFDMEITLEKCIQWLSEGVYCEWIAFQDRRFCRCYYTEEN